jgi:hypothetical protein
MLLVTAILILIQLVVAGIAPARFVLLSLWIQTIPYTWNWDTQSVFQTPIGPLNVVAMQLFGFVLACLVAVVTQIDRTSLQIRNCKWHIAFIAFCLLSILYAPSAVYGLRMIAKLLGPLLFMIAILSVTNSEAELQNMQRAIFGSGVIILALALYARAAGISSDPNFSMTGLSGLGPPSMGPPVFSAHMLPVAMLALATYLCKPRTTTLILLIASSAGIVAALQRTSAGALYLGFSTILFFGTRGVRRLLLPILPVLGLPALILFSATFRERMFFGDASPQELLANPTKALASVNGSGRFGLWDIMLRKFFDPSPITGSGIGSTQDYLYTAAGAGVVHSEYVRLLCEVGIAGLVLFVVAAISYLLRLRTYVARSNGESTRVPALAALGSLVAYLVFFSTDNGIDYVSQFGIYVFALIAIAIKSNQLAKVTYAHEEMPSSMPAPAFPNLLR